jgi:hypothetical protein
MNLTFQRFRLVPYGNHSYIEVRWSTAEAQVPTLNEIAVLLHIRNVR